MKFLKIEYYGTTFHLKILSPHWGAVRIIMRTNAPFYVVQSSLSAHIFLLVYISQFNWYVT